MANDQNTIQNVNQDKKGRGIKDFFRMGEVGGYFFRKKDPEFGIELAEVLGHGANAFGLSQHQVFSFVQGKVSQSSSFCWVSFLLS